VLCCACCGPSSLAQHRCCAPKHGLFVYATSIIQLVRVDMLRILRGLQHVRAHIINRHLAKGRAGRQTRPMFF
jgi:hypothetical protein